MKKLMIIFYFAVLATTSFGQQVSRPRAGVPGSWRLLGTTEARHTADHDAIVVAGPYDNFRRIKFKVTGASLNIVRMSVVYDSGQPQPIATRFSIPEGGESRIIDLIGGVRSIRRIDFWYDTRSFLRGRAKVTLFGMK